MSRTLLMAASAALALLLASRQAGLDDGHGPAPTASYHNDSGQPDAWSGGERKIPISTPKGSHQIWSKRIQKLRKLK